LLRRDEDLPCLAEAEPEPPEGGDHVEIHQAGPERGPEVPTPTPRGAPIAPRVLGFFALIVAELWQVVVVDELGRTADPANEWTWLVLGLELESYLVIPLGYLACITGTRSGSVVAIVCVGVLAALAGAAGVAFGWQAAFRLGLPAAWLAIGLLVMEWCARGSVSRARSDV
jgi:hypothetical protein